MILLKFYNGSCHENKFVLQQYAQTLVMKLQLCIQEVSKSLEDTSQQIVQTIPRILREVGYFIVSWKIV